MGSMGGQGCGPRAVSYDGGNLIVRPEPPCADPHARWCGGWGRNTPGYPIGPERHIDSISHKSYYGDMRMTLSIPDVVAHRFQAAVPARQRSRLVTRLLEQELSERDNSLAAACRAANRDRVLAREIDEWQAFEDGIEE